MSLVLDDGLCTRFFRKFSPLLSKFCGLYSMILFPMSSLQPEFQVCSSKRRYWWNEETSPSVSVSCSSSLSIRDFANTDGSKSMVSMLATRKRPRMFSTRVDLPHLPW